jgi:reductive dehalogenase
MNINVAFLIISAISFLILCYSAIISAKENEPKAVKKFFLASFILPLPFLIFTFLEFSYKYEIGIAVLSILVVSLILFIIPLGQNRKYRQTLPVKRIDERDTMFSRNEIIPGTKEFNDYYKRNPDKKAIDDNWRKRPGLTGRNATQYHPFQFASADASFDTIKALRNEVDGKVSDVKVEAGAEEISTYIKRWTKKLGAVDCGITELQDYHIYSVGGRAERYGKEFIKRHKYAIAFTVEMDKDMLATAPAGPVVMESGQQYMEAGKIAIQVAMFIRKLGYDARAHIDGNYEVVCPLVARDAGLGEIGRMGLLMTPKLGPRVRIAVVTTNIPLTTDNPLHDYSVIDFCIKCKKCADVCPSKAISFDNMKDVDGIKRWQINQEACFTLWCTLGTDCGRCVSVCPFSHPDNLLHNIVRAGIKNSSLFRTVALKLDDAIYDRKPAAAKVPEWMDVKWEKNKQGF